MKALLLLRASFAPALLLMGCGKEEPLPPESEFGGGQAVTLRQPTESLEPSREPPPGPEETAYLKPASPARGIFVKANHIVEWDFEEHSTPVRYRMGRMQVVVRAVPSGQMEDEHFELEVSAKVPGRKVRTLRERNPDLRAPVSLGHGRLDRAGTPYLLVYTPFGGLVGLTGVQALVAYQKGIKAVDLGYFLDVDYERMPKDEDGDEVVDFVLQDISFLDRFGPNRSLLPPKVVNIIDGREVDVSTRRAFRDLFATFAADARERCRHPSQATFRNGSCASYVASSVRTGTFNRAWADMLKAYDRQSDWGLEKGCRVKVDEYEPCPEDMIIRHADYPTALKAHLREMGYLRG